jgi:hypothetical protein
MSRRLSKADLEAVVEVLKKPLRPTPPRKETRSELRLRVEARTEAEKRLAEHRAAEIRWEVSDDPLIVGIQGTFAAHALAEAETRARLRGEPEPLPDTASPAVRALARIEDEKRGEMTWSQYRADGWGEPE